METEKLIQNHSTKFSPESRPLSDQDEKVQGVLQKGSSKTHPLAFLLEPIEWVQMLSSKLSPTLIFGIFLVYGLSQGFSGSFFIVVTDYYWKDVQKVQPSTVQLYMGFYYIPWVMKPIWGLLTDVFPIRGYQRRPYFVMAGVVGLVSALIVALIGNLPVALALGCLIGVAGAMAIADVVIDACIARNSIEIRSLAPDMQSLCGFCTSGGALIGYAASGFFVHRLGAQGALGILAIPAAMFIVLGFIIREMRTPSLQPEKKKKAVEKLRLAMEGMFKAIKYPQVWKPSLYIYLALALSISTHEGQFYWYTDPNAGPAFTQEFVGIIHAIGALASMAGVLIYHKMLKDYQFRRLLFFAQLLYAASGTFDLIFILRWNLILRIPDSFFIVTEECLHRIVSRIRWIPMIVLSNRLCPPGIEGTFFALLMCLDSLGQLSSKLGGGLVLHLFHVTRTEFKNLWLVVLLRNVLRFVTLCFVFLVPTAGYSDDLVPSNNLAKNLGDISGGEEESSELVALNEMDRV